MNEDGFTCEDHLTFRIVGVAAILGLAIIAVAGMKQGGEITQQLIAERAMREPCEKPAESGHLVIDPNRVADNNGCPVCPDLAFCYQPTCGPDWDYNKWMLEWARNRVEYEGKVNLALDDLPEPDDQCAVVYRRANNQEVCLFSDPEFELGKNGTLLTIDGGHWDSSDWIPLGAQK